MAHATSMRRAVPLAGCSGEPRGALKVWQPEGARHAVTTLTPSTRIRPSPFHAATLAAGLTHVTTYNRMILPTGYGDARAEYDRLLHAVSLWDVGAERQVEMRGGDAARLAQALCARRLDGAEEGQGLYVPVCDHRGTLVNDPIALKLAPDRWWLSIADSDVLLHARAVAGERGLDVRVHEPDVSPLAVQGPRAEDVVAGVFGDWVRDVRRFRFRETAVENIPVMVARSGWSGQGGFEIYLLDGTRGTRLWDIVMEAGRSHGIGPGSPNAVERIESGLLSWGGDTDDETNPFEVRMGRYTHTDVPDDTVGARALRRIEAEGPRRHQLGAVLEGDEPLPVPSRWCAVTRDGERVGDLTNLAWSWRMGANIGFALVARDAAAGDTVSVAVDARGDERGDGRGNGREVAARLVELPFL